MTDFNYILGIEYADDLDKEILDKHIFGNEPVTYLSNNSTIFDILKHSGLFKSKKEAQRNWCYGPVLPGFNDFNGLGKLRHRLTIMKYCRPLIES